MKTATTGNRQVGKIMKRITALLKDIEKHPYSGLGKPVPLKGNLQGKWSRRITDDIEWFTPSAMGAFTCMYSH